jgi:hypothetical protein
VIVVIVAFVDGGVTLGSEVIKNKVNFVYLVLELLEVGHHGKKAALHLFGRQGQSVHVFEGNRENARFHLINNL